MTTTSPLEQALQAGFIRVGQASAPHDPTHSTPPTHPQPLRHVHSLPDRSTSTVTTPRSHAIRIPFGVLAIAMAVLTAVSALAQIQPGSLDPGYQYFAGGAFNVKALSLEPDGRIVAVPETGAFSVLTAAGTLEAPLYSFGHPNSGDFSVLRQSSGRLIARQNFLNPVDGRTLSGIGGFDLAGTLDPNFIFPAIPAGGTRSYNGAMAIALGANDRVHIVGRNLPFGGVNTRFWVTLDKDGNELFGLTGAPQDEGLHIVEQPDGKVLMAGTMVTPAGNVGLVRRLATGELDPNFNATLPGPVLVLRLMPDGRGLVAGYSTTKYLPYVWVLNNDGSRDTRFNSTAAVETYSMDLTSVLDILAEPDGRVIVAGKLNGSGKSKALIRLLPSGELDPTFDSALSATSPVNVMVRKDNLLYVGINPAVLRVLLGEPSVSVKPEITEDPASGAYEPSSFVSLKVVATGSPPLTYQWRFNGQPITGQTGPTYDFQMTTLLIGDYDVVVSNGAGSDTSLPARITVRTAEPLVSLPPTFSLVLGGSTSLGATISDAVPPLTYQWLKNDQPIPGETNVSLSFPSASAADVGTYRFVLNDTFGHSVTSGPCVVTVEVPTAPLVFADPQKVIAVEGTPANLIAKFYSQPLAVVPVVQWRRNGTNIPGGTVQLIEGLFTAVLTLPGLQSGDQGYYDCVASNAGGTSPATKAARVLVKTATAPDVVDPAFNAGTANRIAFNNPNADGAIEGIAVQSDDKIIVVGTFKEWNGQARTNIVRLNVDGSLDLSFAAHHFTATANGEMSVPGVAIAPDGRIYVTGNWGTMDGGNRTPLVRLNANGTQDTSFNPGDAAPGYLLLTRPDGTLLNNGVAVVNNAERYLLHYPAGGALDVVFGTGFTASRFSGSGPSAWFPNPDGTLILGGAFGAVDGGGFAQFNLTKLNPNGSVAPGFRSPLSQPDFVNHVARLPDGRFIATGDFQTPVRNVRRFLADGSADDSFVSPLTGAEFSPIAVDTDGSVILPANTGNDLFRLESGGTPDEGFLVQVNDNINLIALDSKGRIVIAGYFSQVIGSFNDAAHTVARKSIARLYGRNGGGASPGGVTMGPPSFVAGQISFTVPTVAGKTYEVQFKSSISDATWAVKETLIGDGTVKTVTVGASGQSGFVQLAVRP